MALVTEDWKQIPGFDRYEVSDLGNVRRTEDHRLVNQHDNDGYQMVFLYDAGKSRGRYVHRLILEAFVGPAPAGFESCHTNGIRFDNKLTNLRWGSRQSNNAEKLAHGTDFRGLKSPRSKFTRGCVERVLDMVACGISRPQIASWFGVHPETVARCIRSQENA